MIFYHGSKKVISEIKTKGSSVDNDYGPSFYLTLDESGAKEWACKNNEVGIVNKYQIRNKEYSSLKILDLTNKEKYSVITWLAILMHFRTLDPSFRRTFENRLKWLEQYYVDVNEFDVIKGFRADDSYFKFPIKFISGQLSFENLEKIFLLGNLGIQYAFMSDKAINCLKFISSTNCEEEYVARYYHLVQEGTREFEHILSLPIDDHETFITDLMKNEK